MSAAGGNNGSGLGVYPPIVENVVEINSPKFSIGHGFAFKSLEQIGQEAREFWNNIPTPIYDEFKAGPQTQKDFREYTNKLNKTYQNCKFFGKAQSRLWPSSESIMATYEGFGDRWINAYKNAEKACQNNDPSILCVEDLVQKYIKNEQQIFNSKQKGKLNKIRAISDKKKIEANRYKKVRTANLLQLNAPKPEPNLLSFEPTQAGLNDRARQLEGLFGPSAARRDAQAVPETQRARKSRKYNRNKKTRKNRRNHTRKN